MLSETVMTFKPLMALTRTFLVGSTQYNKYVQLNNNDSIPQHLNN